MAELAIIALAGLVAPLLLIVAIVAIRRAVRVVPTGRRQGTRAHAVAYEVHRKLEPVQSPGSFAVDEPDADDLQYCQSCGRSSSPGATFCRSCGTLLEQLRDPTRKDLAK